TGRLRWSAPGMRPSGTSPSRRSQPGGAAAALRSGTWTPCRWASSPPGGTWSSAMRSDVHQLVPATEAHALALAPRLRADDLAEIRATAGVSGEAALLG